MLAYAFSLLRYFRTERREGQQSVEMGQEMGRPRQFASTVFDSSLQWHIDNPWWRLTHISGTPLAYQLDRCYQAGIRLRLTMMDGHTDPNYVSLVLDRTNPRPLQGRRTVGRQRTEARQTAVGNDLRELL